MKTKLEVSVLSRGHKINVFVSSPNPEKIFSIKLFPFSRKSGPHLIMAKAELCKEIRNSMSSGKFDDIREKLYRKILEKWRKNELHYGDVVYTYYPLDSSLIPKMS